MCYEWKKPNSGMNGDDVIKILEEFPDDSVARNKLISELEKVINRLKDSNRGLNYKCKATNEHRLYDSISTMLGDIVLFAERAQVAEKFREKGVVITK